MVNRSQYRNDGTLTNMASTAWVTSEGKGALNYLGGTGHVRVNTTHTKNAISMSVWLRIGASPTGFPYPMHLGTTTGVVAGIGSDQSSANIRWVLVDGGGTTICDLSVANPANTMSHFCGTWDGVTANFYRNGGLVATTTSTRTLGTNANVLFIGSLFGAIGIFGTLDDARMYNRALIAPEVRQLYVGGRGFGLLPERPRRRGTAAGAAFNRRRRVLLMAG